MANNLAEDINTLSNYLSEAVYEALTTQDSLVKYQKLINRYAEKAELDLENFNTDLNDFMELFQEAAADFTITSFEEKSLIAQGKLAYIREDTIQKLIQYVKSATKQQDEFIKHELRLPLLEDRQQSAILSEYTQKDQDFIQKDDVVCVLNLEGETHSLLSPVSGRIYYKKGLGEEIIFGATICEIAEEKRTGKFEYFFHNGLKYVGDFLEGEMTGKGIFSTQNEEYIGDVVEGKRSGFGKQTYANGDVYEGNWYTGSRQGFGIYQFQNGDKYEGKWKDNFMNEEGTFTIKDIKNFVLGTTYTLKDGKGTYMLPNGEKAILHFKKNKDISQHKGISFDGSDLLKIAQGRRNIPEGFGFYSFKDGKQFIGSFQEGNLHKGFLLYPKEEYPKLKVKNEFLAGQGMIAYGGSFKNNQPHGKGFAFPNYYADPNVTVIAGNHYEVYAEDGIFLQNIIPNLQFYEGEIQKGKGKVCLNPREFDDELKYNKKYLVYEGNFANYQFHGKGTLKTPTYQYEGNFENGLFQGQGKFKRGKKQWEGTFNKNQFIKGKMFENEELIYEGEFKDCGLKADYIENPKRKPTDGFFHGKGKQTAGDEYWEGEFENGDLWNGKVKIKVSMQVPMSDSSDPIYGTYEGEYQNQKIQGLGKFNYEESYLEGTFEDGVFLKGNVQMSLSLQAPFYGNKTVVGIFGGQISENEETVHGIFTWDKDSVMSGEFKNKELVKGVIKIKGTEYDGELQNRKPHGKGTIKHSDGYSYEGEFKDGMKEGFGKEVHDEDTYYEGEWMADKKHGEGKLVTPNGEVYEGQFEDGMKDGMGKLKMNNGDVYEGAFQSDFFNGEGSLQAVNGDYYQGQWSWGKRDGEGVQHLANENKTLTGLWRKDELVKDYDKKNLWEKMFGKKS